MGAVDGRAPSLLKCMGYLCLSVIVVVSVLVSTGAATELASASLLMATIASLPTPPDGSLPQARARSPGGILWQLAVDRGSQGSARWPDPVLDDAPAFVNRWPVRRPGVVVGLDAVHVRPRPRRVVGVHLH